MTPLFGLRGTLVVCTSLKRYCKLLKGGMPSYNPSQKVLAGTCPAPQDEKTRVDIATAVSSFSRVDLKQRPDFLRHGGVTWQLVS